jgi:superfamily I DNA/RNA helicase
VLLRRGRGGWSDADLPLIDEARDVLLDTSGRYGHVIVDEAQDLTPMQLRMIARRAAGAFTVLGDIAQATGPVPYGRWEELLPHLPGGERARIYVALTRPTTTLVVVHARPLPSELNLPTRS